jgi:hypothetical protein
MLYGPNTNCGACSIIFMLERQSRYIVKCIRELRARGLRYLEVKPEAEAAFNDDLHQRNKRTTYESGCHSWYINAEGRNTNNWVGHTSEYGRLLHRLRLDDYRLVAAETAG